MKKTINVLSALLLLLGLSTIAKAQTWNFGTVSATDKTNLNADKTNWTYDSNNNRWLQQAVLNDVALVANGSELEFSQGLTITTTAADQIRVDAKKGSLTMNNQSARIKIHGAKAGQILTVVSQSSKSGTARVISATNINVTSGFGSSDSKVTNVGTVIADGDIEISVGGGTYVYSIKLVNEGEEPEPVVVLDDLSNVSSSLKNQAIFTLNNSEKRFYNTETLSSIDIDGSNVKVNVGSKNYIFKGNVANVSFRKAENNSGIIENKDGQVEITKAAGWLETAYVEFKDFAGATNYNVYVKGGQYSDFTKIDGQLVRSYGSYNRADALGLKAGTYEVKVVPVNGKSEMTAAANTATNLVVKNVNRDGYAHYNATEGIGAYNNDGTLKDGARVLYITKDNAKTVTLSMKVDKNEEVRTGIQDILQAYEKGTETRPLAVRIIGCLKKADMPTLGSSSIGLQVKGKGQNMNLTIEGVGNDATMHGYGVLVRNCQYVELRNFAVMMHPEDGISFDTDNEHVWGHNLDIFYGENKGGDKAKGDGSFDVKGTFFCSVSANHFWDAGKCNLNSNGDEVDYVTYHHNWYDHSDSRHPRVRKSQHLHVFNNYFDGVSKYGVGSTTGSCIFVDKNYFRNCKYPMLISLQGSDINNGVGSKDDTKGTFSSEEGGIIKAFDNYMVGQKNFQPYNAADATNSVHFDAYLAKERDEQVPSTVKTLKGGTGYNNFDTASDFYEYTPDAKEEVPNVVTGAYGAGRCEHGDFQWTFDNATEDTNYEVISDLSNTLKSYSSKLVKIYGE